jgi:protease PrsW
VLVTFGAVAFGFGLWLFIVRRYDRIEPESLRSLLAAALLGGGGAFLVAGLINEVVSSALGVRVDFTNRAGEVPQWRIGLFCLFVGLNEEAWKALAALIGTRRLRLVDEPVDAMIFAMSVALGFAAAENLVYAQAYGNEVLLVRFLWPVPAHLAYAAVWGYGLARARFGVLGRRPPLLVFAGSVVAGGLLHAAANFMLVTQNRWTPLLSLAGLVALAFLAHHRLLKLAAQSPFLEPGECPACRNLNPPDRPFCLYCGTPLQGSEEFRTRLRR